jgi:hypothetical protein
MSDIDPTTGRKTATDRRPHVNLAIDFFTHRKHDSIVDPIARAAARALHGHSITLAKAGGSDGHIDPQQALADMGLPVEFGKAMIADGAWHQDDHGCLRCPQPRACTTTSSTTAPRRRTRRSARAAGARLRPATQSATAIARPAQSRKRLAVAPGGRGKTRCP